MRRCESPWWSAPLLPCCPCCLSSVAFCDTSERVCQFLSGPLSLSLFKAKEKEVWTGKKNVFFSLCFCLASHYLSAVTCVMVKVRTLSDSQAGQEVAPLQCTNVEMSLLITAAESTHPRTALCWARRQPMGCSEQVYLSVYSLIINSFIGLLWNDWLAYGWLTWRLSTVNKDSRQIPMTRAIERLLWFCLWRSSRLTVTDYMDTWGLVAQWPLARL